VQQRGKGLCIGSQQLVERCQIAYPDGVQHGCALWIDTGGVPALSAEAHLLREAVYRLEVLDWHTGGSNGPQPKRIELPEPAHEARARQAVMAEKARKHAARDRRRSQPTT